MVVILVRVCYSITGYKLTTCWTLSLLMPVTPAGCFTVRFFTLKNFFVIALFKGYPCFGVVVYASHTPLHQLYKCRYPFGGSRFILLLPASGYLYTRFNLLFSSNTLFYIGVCTGWLLQACNVNVQGKTCRAILVLLLVQRVKK